MMKSLEWMYCIDFVWSDDDDFERLGLGLGLGLDILMFLDLNFVCYLVCCFGIVFLGGMKSGGYCFKWFFRNVLGIIIVIIIM